jgi:hypothetical protein
MVESPSALGLREPEDDAGEPGAQQRRAEPLERAGVGAARVCMQQPDGDQDRHHRDGHVDDEDPLPGRVVDDQAADDRPEDRREQDRHAHERQSPPDAPGPGGLCDQREADRNQQAASHTL